MKNKKGALALPWEKIIWWALLFLFFFFVLWFYGGIGEQAKNMMKNIFNFFK
ncbi:hypothetical protein KY366_01215 [Candidatus Woesearchaeota archaeon]|nr:hypothetical protein [Candidatus Woesearchaeota archaeon]